MTATEIHPPPPVLHVRAWWEPELATTGHDPLGPYPETHWLPVLGPAATLAHRWLVRGLREHPQGYEVPLESFARGMGLGKSRGRNGPAARALRRLCYFGLARERGDVIDVRTHLPTVPEHLTRRLPGQLRSQPPNPDRITAPGRVKPVP